MFRNCGCEVKKNSPKKIYQFKLKTDGAEWDITRRKKYEEIIISYCNYYWIFDKC